MSYTISNMLFDLTSIASNKYYRFVIDKLACKYKTMLLFNCRFCKNLYILIYYKLMRRFCQLAF